MDLVSLILHGLHAISVFAETVVIRLSLLIAGLIGISMVSVVLFRIFADSYSPEWAPGWASAMIGILAVVSLQIIFLLINTTLLVLQNRSLSQMLPAIDYSVYIDDIVKLISRK